jgi:hypothetical protein
MRTEEQTGGNPNQTWVLMLTKLRDVNTTDISDAIRLGCRCMCNCFNADDDDIPYFGADVRPEARLRSSSEAHTPGRHLNALLNAEDALGIEIDEEAVDKHAKAAFFSYSQLPLCRRWRNWPH